MAIIIPTARSTFGDATRTPGGPMSSYVLAQLPADSDLGWVTDVRSLCVVDELKWKTFQSRRERLQAKPELWRKVLDSMRSATVVVIRPTDVKESVTTLWKESGAVEGVDYDERKLIDACATALIADTPVAYLPNQISRALNLYPEELYLSFDEFAPDAIKERIGGTLRDAKVFAARAHAIFDSTRMSGVGTRTGDAFSHPAASIVLCELLSTERGFDREHPRSAQVLNEAVDTMARSLEEALFMPGEFTNKPLVKEYDSREVDHLQAADIAAGWAHEMLALGNERGVGDAFGKVIVNGRQF